MAAANFEASRTQRPLIIFVWLPSCSNETGATHPGYPHVDIAAIFKRMRGSENRPPRDAAKIMFDLAIAAAAPPLRLSIGKDAQWLMDRKMQQYEADLAKWRKVSTFEADVASVAK